MMMLLDIAAWIVLGTILITSGVVFCRYCVYLMDSALTWIENKQMGVRK